MGMIVDEREYERGVYVRSWISGQIQSRQVVTIDRSKYSVYTRLYGIPPNLEGLLIIEVNQQ